MPDGAADPGAPFAAAGNPAVDYFDFQGMRRLLEQQRRADRQEQPSAGGGNRSKLDEKPLAAQLLADQSALGTVAAPASQDKEQPERSEDDIARRLAFVQRAAKAGQVLASLAGQGDLASTLGEMAGEAGTGGERGGAGGANLAGRGASRIARGKGVGGGKAAAIGGAISGLLSGGGIGGALGAAAGWFTLWGLLSVLWGGTLSVIGVLAAVAAWICLTVWIILRLARIGRKFIVAFSWWQWGQYVGFGLLLSFIVGLIIYLGTYLYCSLSPTAILQRFVGNKLFISSDAGSACNEILDNASKGEVPGVKGELLKSIL